MIQPRTQQHNVADFRAGRERPERIGPNIRTWLNWGNEDSRTCHWRGPLLSVCIMAMLFASQMLLSSASRWALIAFPVFGSRGLGTWVLVVEGCGGFDLGPGVARPPRRVGRRWCLIPPILRVVSFARNVATDVFFVPLVQ